MGRWRWSGPLGGPLTRLLAHPRPGAGARQVRLPHLPWHLANGMTSPLRRRGRVCTWSAAFALCSAFRPRTCCRVMCSRASTDRISAVPADQLSGGRGRGRILRGPPAKCFTASTDCMILVSWDGRVGFLMKEAQSHISNRLAGGRNPAARSLAGPAVMRSHSHSPSPVLARALRAGHRGAAQLTSASLMRLRDRLPRSGAQVAR
jgi:hypothetical protein